MDRFSPGRFGNDDPWFRVGDFGITTTIAVTITGLLSIIVWAIEGVSSYGPILRQLPLVAKGENFGGASSLGVLEGGVWRLVTWPIPNRLDGFFIFTLLLFYIFYILGSQLEGAMGRIRFSGFLLALTVIPAVIVTIFEAITGITGFAAGLRLLEVGVLIAFAAHQPNVRFWPGIPAWGIAVGIVVLETLQTLGNRNGGESYQYQLLLLFSIVGVSLLGIRALGFADEWDWIPVVPLPPKWGGDPYRAANKRRERGVDVGSGFASGGVPKPRFPGRGPNLQSVPPPDPNDAVADAEIDSLLDQVASSGLDSLTPAQRKRLEAHSKRLRKRGK